MADKLPIAMDMVGWEYMDNAPKDRVILGGQTDRPGIVYFMLWWEPLGRWQFAKPNAQGNKMVLDQGPNWEPEPDRWMDACTRWRFTGWSKGEGAIDPETVKPGDIIKVWVGGVEYDTIIDDRGVQRFIENPDHPLIKLAGKVWDRATSQYVEDLNGMALRYHRKEFSQRDYAEMNMALGYSVSGFCDLSSFQDMEVENPLWA